MGGFYLFFLKVDFTLHTLHTLHSLPTSYQLVYFNYTLLYITLHYSTFLRSSRKLNKRYTTNWFKEVTCDAWCKTLCERHVECLRHELVQLVGEKRQLKTWGVGRVSSRTRRVWEPNTFLQHESSLNRTNYSCLPINSNVPTIVAD